MMTCIINVLTCKKCHQKTCINTPNKQFLCNSCKLECSNDQCLMSHQENICTKLLKCQICGRIKSTKHTCNGRWCLNYKSPVDMNHKCYILTEEERNVKTNVVALRVFQIMMNFVFGFLNKKTT